MGFRLDDMIGKYKDFARGYLFYAQVTTPAGVAIQADHPYLVKSTTLPKQTIEQSEVDWQGNKYKFGNTSTFDAITVTFRSDVAQELRREFLRWMQVIHDPVSNIHGNPANYFGQVDLTQLDGQGNPIMSYKLVNAWPNDVAEIGLDYGTKEPSEFAVSFTYQYHVVDSVFDGPPATDVQL
jgi:hypothetical protein